MLNYRFELLTMICLIVPSMSLSPLAMCQDATVDLAGGDVAVDVDVEAGPAGVDADEATDEMTDNNGEAKFTPAIALLPETVAGLVRVPNLPKLCDASSQTLLGQMFADPAMQPFVDSQRDRAKDYLQSINDKVGITAEELYNVASGEVVFAWLPFEADSRRPYALVVIADIRDRPEEVKEAMKKIDDDLTTTGWTRADRTHQGESFRTYSRKPKPGQLKIEQISIYQSDERLIAADRDTVVTELIDAIAGRNSAPKIAQNADFKTVLQRSARELVAPTRTGGGTIAAEWFVKPFAMGRIVRRSMKIDRGNDVNILNLLENQGFDAIKAAGGIVVINGKTYDVLHRGYVLAPPTVAGDARYAKAAAMLQLPNIAIKDFPAWIPDSIAAVTRVAVKMENAFWSSEPLVNEAVGDDIFRDMIEGIKEDRDGPQIDLAGNVLPNLDDFVLVLRDNVKPITLDSERLLVAIRVRDGEKIRSAVKKMMQAEPDATLVDGPSGVEIYRVQRSDDGPSDLEADLFGDFDDEPADEGPAPLLEKWAIGLVPVTANNPNAFLMISSDDRFLADIAGRAIAGGGNPLTNLEEIQTLRTNLIELAGEDVALTRWVRTRLSMRAKYELLRQGKLRDSDSIGSSVFRRIVNEKEMEDVDAELVAFSKLPPIEKIEKYLPNGASSFTTTEDGWKMSGFFLK